MKVWSAKGKHQASAAALLGVESFSTESKAALGLAIASLYLLYLAEYTATVRDVSTAQLASVVLTVLHGPRGITQDMKYLCPCPQGFDADHSSLQLYRTMFEAMHSDK